MARSFHSIVVREETLFRLDDISWNEARGSVHKRGESDGDARGHTSVDCKCFCETF